MAALADPAAIGIRLSTDNTLWPEPPREPEPWRPTETMSATRAEAVLRTVVGIASERTLEVAFRLDGSYLVGQPFGAQVRLLQTKGPGRCAESLIRV